MKNSQTFDVWGEFDLYPNATAPATASPMAADFPRPRAAVRATVLLRVFSETASINFSTALACRNQNIYYQRTGRRSFKTDYILSINQIFDFNFWTYNLD